MSQENTPPRIGSRLFPILGVTPSARVRLRMEDRTGRDGLADKAAAGNE